MLTHVSIVFQTEYVTLKCLQGKHDIEKLGMTHVFIRLDA